MSKTKLKDPDITNVDLVDRPANPGARIMLFKRDVPVKKNLLQVIAKKLGITDKDLEDSDDIVKSDGAETFSEAFSESSARRVMDDFWIYTSSLLDSIQSIIEDSAISDKTVMITDSLDQFKAAVLEVVPDLVSDSQALSVVPLTTGGQVEGVAKIGKVISTANLEKLRKVVMSIQTMISECEKTKGVETKMDGIAKVVLSKEVIDALPKDVQAYIAKLEEELAALKNAKPNVLPDVIPEVDIMKSLSPAIKKLFSDMELRTKAAEDVAKRSIDEQVLKTFVAKSAAFTNLGIVADEFGPVLKSISEKAPEALERIESVLKAANEAVEKGNLFKEVGSGRAGSKVLGTNATWAKIQESARNSVAKSGVAMSEEQAVDKFLTTPEGKALYNEYLQERSAK